MRDAIVCSFTFILVACVGDPAAPTAEGSIALGVADAGPFSTIEVRLCQADAGVSPSCGQVSPERAASITPDGGFPVPYRVGGGLGGTSVREWKVIAWFSRGDAGVAPASGELWGEAALTLKDCSGGCSSNPCYCAGGTVNVSVQRVAP